MHCVYCIGLVHEMYVTAAISHMDRYNCMSWYNENQLYALCIGIYHMFAPVWSGFHLCIGN